MAGSTVRKFDEHHDWEEDGSSHGSVDSQEMEDALDDIDWGELQDFFFQHLHSQLGEMQQLLTNGDAAALGRIGHGIKGSGGGVRLPFFTDLGRNLEDAGKAGDLSGTREACLALLQEYLKYHPEDEEDLNGYFRAA